MTSIHANLQFLFEVTNQSIIKQQLSQSTLSMDVTWVQLGLNPGHEFWFVEKTMHLPFGHIRYDYYGAIKKPIIWG